MENLEQQCEDAVFELCDAREQFPSLCANELTKCIQIKNDINMSKVSGKPSVIDKSSTSEKGERLDLNVNQEEICFDHLDSRLQNVISTLNNLKAVVDQTEREKQCPIKKLLQD
ncbi:uncharacterized protein LOC108631054 [Ceratina calcarata]|uniref:Uncharacterized protein LOC108631054 n=1 Tax=Ceratina calcarata TaxID=156304 RepID=A0AAJ7NDS4_9HYME|nr:uncharacterized protein LOC108631054 [Ceratina calcarata]